MNKASTREKVRCRAFKFCFPKNNKGKRCYISGVNTEISFKVKQATVYK